MLGALNGQAEKSGFVLFISDSIAVVLTQIRAVTLMANFFVEH
jgi:hypothetical protein